MKEFNFIKSVEKLDLIIKERKDFYEIRKVIKKDDGKYISTNIIAKLDKNSVFEYTINKDIAMKYLNNEVLSELIYLLAQFSLTEIADRGNSEKYRVILNGTTIVRIPFDKLPKGVNLYRDLKDCDLENLLFEEEVNNIKSLIKDTDDFIVERI